MRPLLVSLALLVLCALVDEVRAEEPPLTGLEAGPFARADAVLLAKVLSMTDVRAPGGAAGRQVVTAEVIEAYKSPPAPDGLEPAATFALIVLGQRPTLDPARPSEPYFRRGDTGTYVFFLARATGAYAWSLQTLFDAQDRDGRAKAAAVSAVGTWRGITDPQARAQRTLRDLLAMAVAADAWTRTHGARELAWLAQARPDVFDAASQARIARLLPTARSADQRFWLRRILALLDARGTDGSSTGPVAEEDPWRATFLESQDPQERQALLTRLLAPGNPAFGQQAWWAWQRLEPSMRAWFVDALVETGHREAVAELRRAYAGEEDPDVRAALVRAVGRLGGAEDVGWLAARVANLPLRRVALLGLARIRTEEALSRLRQVRSVSDADTAAWIEHLLSPEFLEAERRAGRR